MKNKLTQFLLEHFPQIIEKTKNEIQQIENTMIGENGKIKKSELDKRIIDYISDLIKKWDIPQVPNIIEDNILDPASIMFIENYLPEITQGIYNVGTIGIKKINNIVN